MIRFPNENNAPVRSLYNLGRELGSGAFSVVVEGTEIKTTTKFAIKIVNKEETNAREMFQELNIMSLLSHVNVVHFKEIFDEDDGYFVVMELITGGELFDRIIELRRYSEIDASKVMKQALLGIKHMHDKNLVHRDIKPENLLLSSKDSEAIVKIADFGFSKAIKSDHDLYETLGTPPYMAPEIVILRNEDEDHPGYGRPVDVWALGICLYILLSGIHPYQIEDEEKMLDNIEQGLWPGWKGSNWGFISKEAKDLITGMMNPNVAKRLTIQQCLESAWITSLTGPVEPNQYEQLGGVQDSIKAYQARKKFKGAVELIRGINKLKLFVAPVAPVAAANPLTSSRAAKNLEWKTLTVHVHAGRNLAPKDPNGKSDPYVMVWCGGVKPFKTKIKYKTLNPEWEHESFEVAANSADGKNIEIECWDHDLIPPDDFMGRIVIPVESFKEIKKKYKDWYPLEAVKGDKAKRGVVKGELLLEFEKH